MSKPLSHHRSFSSVIQNFTPNWFAVNMGTGITALCLGTLPWQPFWIHNLALSIWLLNAVLFCLFLGAWLTSLARYSALHLNILQHSALPFFLGCLPMGMTTVLNGLIVFGLPLWGDSMVTLAQFLLFINAATSCLVVLVVPYFMFTRHEHSLEKMTAIWLLPIVAPEVSASSAGIIASHLAPSSAYPLLILGYMLWGVSLALAFSVITIFVYRLAIHKLPAKELGATVWLPLGPISMGAFGLMTLGRAADHLIQNGEQMPGLALMHPLGLIGGMALLGFSTWIAAISLLITLSYLRKGLPFNMSFWSFTFPLGVYAIANLTLGADTGLSFFKYYGTFLTAALVLVWIAVAVKTLPGLYKGNLIKNPLIT